MLGIYSWSSMSILRELSQLFLVQQLVEAADAVASTMSCWSQMTFHLESNHVPTMSTHVCEKYEIDPTWENSEICC